MDDATSFPELLGPEFFTGVVEASPDPYVIVDIAGTVRWASRTAPDLVGMTIDEYVGSDVAELIAPGSLEVALEAFAEYSSPDLSDTGWVGPPLPIDLLHRDGRPIPCEVRRVPSRVPFPGVLLMISTRGPMLSLYETIERIVADEPIDDVLGSILRLIGVESPYSIPVVGIGWTGDGFENVVASHEAPALGGRHLPVLDDARTPWQRYFADGHPRTDDHLDEVDPALRQAALDAGAAACWVMPVDEHDRIDLVEQDVGRSVVVLWRRAPGRPRLNVERRLERIRALVGLALRSARSRDQLQRAARTDAVTGLPNRLALGEHFEAMAHRRDDDLIGVLYCDLDHFKAVNDAHGHPTGDRALRIAAERMRARLRSEDVVARVGGDEFVVVTRTADRSAISALAERLLTAFDEPIVLGDVAVPVGTSVGVAAVPSAELGVSVTGEALVELADAALLDAKATGKHRIVWAAPPAAATGPA